MLFPFDIIRSSSFALNLFVWIMRILALEAWLSRLAADFAVASHTSLF
jgi:hypothetical protein